MHPKGLAGECPVKGIIKNHQEKVIEDVKSLTGKRPQLAYVENKCPFESTPGQNKRVVKSNTKMK